MFFNFDIILSQSFYYEKVFNDSLREDNLLIKTPLFCQRLNVRFLNKYN